MINTLVKCLFRVYNKTLTVSATCPFETWDAFFDYCRLLMPPGMQLTLTISDLTKTKVNIN